MEAQLGLSLRAALQLVKCFGEVTLAGVSASPYLTQELGERRHVKSVGHRRLIQLAVVYGIAQ
eukprot:scaffold166678_cov18-Prasinocladus_malaysianus.AAC.1